jgi:hypothetical protein
MCLNIKLSTVRLSISSTVCVCVCVCVLSKRERERERSKSECKLNGRSRKRKGWLSTVELLIEVGRVIKKYLLIAHSRAGDRS